MTRSTNSHELLAYIAAQYGRVLINADTKNPGYTIALRKVRQLAHNLNVSMDEAMDLVTDDPRARGARGTFVRPANLKRRIGR